MQWQQHPAWRLLGHGIWQLEPSPSKKLEQTIGLTLLMFLKGLLHARVFSSVSTARQCAASLLKQTRP